MTVLITLTTAGADTGNFNLYSNLDGYTAAFETGVDKTALEAGYISYVVPDGTTIVRVKSDALCQNYIDISLVEPTTTTTTTTTAPPYDATMTFTTQHVGGDYETYMTVTYGALLDSLTASGTVQGYTDTGCSVTSDTGTFAALTVNPGPTYYAFTSLSGNPHNDWQSRKLTSLTVESISIISNPQDIVVGGHTYRIIGLDICETL
jgi:hypothetical protein